MQNLTSDNLLRYITEKYVYHQIEITSKIIDVIGDGLDIYYLLDDLEKDFNVDFSNFDFTSYFHSEDELSNLGCLAFWKRKKERPIKDFTIDDLYKYMIKHQLPNNKKQHE